MTLLSLAILSLLTAGEGTTSVEQEVADNILSQRIGEFEVRDLNLPELFVRRAADRIIRASYHQRYHQVIQDPQPSPAGPQSDPPPVFETRPHGGDDAAVTSNGAVPPGPHNQQSSLTRPPGMLRVGAALGILGTMLILVIAGYRRSRTIRS